MEIDPRFRAARQESRRRRRNSWLVPLILWVGGLSVLSALGAGLFFGGVLSFGHPTAREVTENVGVQEDGAVIDVAATYNTAFVDLAGDPMILRFDTTGMDERRKTLPRPVDIPGERAGPELILLTDDMITTEERLITTLPSSREDFAFFQAQREAKAMQPVALPVPVAAESAPVETVVVAQGEGSWGDSIDGVADSGAPDTYTRTKIENTTSLSFIQRESQRKMPYEDVILRIREATDLAALMVENGVDAAAAARFVEEGMVIIPEVGALVPGHILAFRKASRGDLTVPVQLSLYTRDSYAGTLALADDGHVAEGADPWVEEDLFTFAGEDQLAEADIGRKYRLLDAFYSAAIRNGVPSAVVAETIVMLSQAHDMESFASPGDKMTLLYAPDAGAGGAGPGQVLFASIKGEGRDLECNVFRVQGKEDYACFGKGGAGGGGGVQLRGGMVTPTPGVLTSRFGPRMHPILKVAKLHKGTDWAAPTGTPIVAAFAGQVNYMGDGGGYGNLVKISHPDGTETRYAHMSAFAEGLVAGAQVQAGTLIGYVGTTGQSTGPHLHFELYVGGEAMDPFASAGAVMAGSGSAVEQLVDQIIRVESGGNASAKNPLSTATGLGQFIESTWIRMMAQYRPDLAGTMSRADLLALRNDPTLSREMITALAREGEAYLQARGHQITAGRLYLCHFLGAAGADMVLKAQDDQLVGDVMGAGVVSANPFLQGRTIAYVKEWAELKMNRKGGGALPVVPVLPPEVLAYQKLIAGLIGAPA